MGDHRYQWFQGQVNSELIGEFNDDLVPKNVLSVLRRALLDGASDDFTSCVPLTGCVQFSWRGMNILCAPDFVVIGESGPSPLVISKSDMIPGWGDELRRVWRTAINRFGILDRSTKDAKIVLGKEFLRRAAGRDG